MTTPPYHTALGYPGHSAPPPAMPSAPAPNTIPQDKYIRALEERIDAMREVAERDRIIHQRDAEILRLEREVIAPLRADNFWLRQQLQLPQPGAPPAQPQQATHYAQPAPQQTPQPQPPYAQHPPQPAHTQHHVPAPPNHVQHAQHMQYQPGHAAPPQISPTAASQAHAQSNGKHPLPSAHVGTAYIMLPGRPESLHEEPKPKTKSPTLPRPIAPAPTHPSPPHQMEEAPRMVNEPLRPTATPAAVEPSPGPVESSTGDLSDTEDMVAPPELVPWAQLVRKQFPGSISQLRVAERMIIEGAVKDYLRERLGPERAADCKIQSKMGGKSVDAIPRELEHDFLQWFLHQVDTGLLDAAKAKRKRGAAASEANADSHDDKRAKLDPPKKEQLLGGPSATEGLVAWTDIVRKRFPAFISSKHTQLSQFAKNFIKERGLPDMRVMSASATHIATLAIPTQLADEFMEAVEKNYGSTLASNPRGMPAPPPSPSVDAGGSSGDQTPAAIAAARKKGSGTPLTPNLTSLTVWTDLVRQISGTFYETAGKPLHTRIRNGVAVFLRDNASRVGLKAEECMASAMNRGRKTYAIPDTLKDDFKEWFELHRQTNFEAYAMDSGAATTSLAGNSNILTRFTPTGPPIGRASPLPQSEYEGVLTFSTPTPDQKASGSQITPSARSSLASSSQMGPPAVPTPMKSFAWTDLVRMRYPDMLTGNEGYNLSQFTKQYLKSRGFRTSMSADEEGVMVVAIPEAEVGDYLAKVAAKRENPPHKKLWEPYAKLAHQVMPTFTKLPKPERVKIKDDILEWLGTMIPPKEVNPDDLASYLRLYSPDGTQYTIGIPTDLTEQYMVWIEGHLKSLYGAERVPGRGPGGAREENGKNESTPAGGEKVAGGMNGEGFFTPAVAKPEGNFSRPTTPATKKGTGDEDVVMVDSSPVQQNGGSGSGDAVLPSDTLGRKPVVKNYPVAWVPGNPAHPGHAKWLEQQAKEKERRRAEGISSSDSESGSESGSDGEEGSESGSEEGSVE
ncbi:hypothetical protein HDV00_001268 [Rhizophlyctis rosea]|nr:hypothetical protein HDV00_001268 [Rhizophlyctis rosea]